MPRNASSIPKRPFASVCPAGRGLNLFTGSVPKQVGQPRASHQVTMPGTVREQPSPRRSLPLSNPYKQRENVQMIGSLMMCVSVVVLLVGMLAGIAMGIRRTSCSPPAHAHLNLVGGVLLFLFGLYYRLVPGGRRPARLARVQGWLHIAGGILFPLGVATVLLKGPSASMAAPDRGIADRGGRDGAVRASSCSGPRSIAIASTTSSPASARRISSVNCKASLVRHFLSSSVA